MSKILFAAVASLFIVGCASTGTLDLGEADEFSEPEFQWPVYGAVLTQKFRPQKKSPYRRIHQGVDLAAPKGTPIYAVDHGVVRYVGSGISGYGRLVIIEHLNKNYRSYYAHLSRYKVRRGKFVRKGDLIGLMGKSGRATGVHLHFEIRKNRVAQNPLELLPSATSISSQPANP